MGDSEVMKIITKLQKIRALHVHARPSGSSNGSCMAQPENPARQRKSRRFSLSHVHGAWCECAARMCAHGGGEMESACFRGQPLRLRQLRATDRARIEALLSQVAPADLRMRFFGQFHSVPPALLDQLTRVDPARRLTVAAVRYGGRGEESAEILGVARAHRTAEASAEAALLVRSDLKGEGLGSMLLGSLIARCRRWGVSRLCAEVMESNTRMLRLARRYGFHRASSDQDTCQLVLDLRAHG